MIKLRLSWDQGLYKIIRLFTKSGSWGVIFQSNFWLSTLISTLSWTIFIMFIARRYLVWLNFGFKVNWSNIHLYIYINGIIIFLTSFWENWSITIMFSTWKEILEAISINGSQRGAFPHRPQCTVTLNSNSAISKPWNYLQLA